MPKTIIHVNQHKIKANRKLGNSTDPVITVKTYKSNIYCHEVVVHGPCRVIYCDKPLACGAHVWIETEAEVTWARVSQPR